MSIQPDATSAGAGGRSGCAPIRSPSTRFADRLCARTGGRPPRRARRPTRTSGQSKAHRARRPPRAVQERSARLPRFRGTAQAAARVAPARSFSAIQSISRENVPEYARYAAAVREVVARVNGMTDPDQAPIWLLDGSEYALAIAALSLADVVLVNPVVDGMNLSPRRPRSWPRRDRAVRDGRRRRAACSGRAHGRRGDSLARARCSKWAWTCRLRSARAASAGCAHRSARKTCLVAHPSAARPVRRRHGRSPPSRALRDTSAPSSRRPARLVDFVGLKSSMASASSPIGAWPTRTNPFFSRTRCEPMLWAPHRVNRPVLDFGAERAARPSRHLGPRIRGPANSQTAGPAPGPSQQRCCPRPRRRASRRAARSSRDRPARDSPVFEERGAVAGMEMPPSQPRPGRPDARKELEVVSLDRTDLNG